MSEVQTITLAVVEDEPPPILGLAALARIAFQGIPLGALRNILVERIQGNANDSGAFMDLSVIEQLSGRRDEGVACLIEALKRERLFRRPRPYEGDGLRLLAFMAPGDFMANTPVDFLLDGSNIALDILYLWHGAPMPDIVPDHDVALVAIGESDQTRALLKELPALLRAWPRPIVNGNADRIIELGRDRAFELLDQLPGIRIPRTGRITHGALAAAASGEAPDETGLDGAQFPVILRPIASHAGKDLQKIDDSAALGDYLRDLSDPEFYVAPFIDYRSQDGLFRKYRIAFIDGEPFASHMAISGHWMVHYLNAGMTASPEKREEEARFMADFDAEGGFVSRHRTAFEALVRRVGLDYFVIDCGETVDGEILVFEIDVAMIVHSIDPPELFPYKTPAMKKLFAAFTALLNKRAGIE